MQMAAKIEFLQISSLEKVFFSQRPTCQELTSLTALKNERISYQIAYFRHMPRKEDVKIRISSPLEKYISLRRVFHVPVQTPLLSLNCDEDYILRQPGLAPDALLPVDLQKAELMGDRWETFWVSVDLDGEVPAGTYDIDIAFDFAGGSATKRMTLHILDALLPAQKLKFTQWFHCDCLASCFKVPVFSEAHWAYIEKFLRCAVKNGINMILTPIFTPPLDTEVGGERPTVQLVKVRLENGTYRFDFSLLDRWVELCQGCCIRYFEMAHLFTQWGAKATPKIIATVDGAERRIFGWDVASYSEEYRAFLAAFLPALDGYLQHKGIADVTYFHISDEPKDEEAKANYLAAKALVRKYLKEYKIIDALENIDYYRSGVAELPVVGSNHIEPFLQEEIAERWTYYCTSQGKGVSNRFIAMPSYRTRVIAEQLFKFGIDGFLHWGYNFYYTRYSRAEVNPFVITDADGAFQSGDSFSVYPYKDDAAESLRLVVFADALQDLRAMELLASKIGRQQVIDLLEETAGMEIRFDSYPKSAEYILRRRERINQKLRELL